GSAPGVVQIEATVEGTSVTTTFILASGASTVTQACQGGTPTLPASSGVMTNISGTGICLSGGTSGADYALIPFHGSQVANARTSFTVIGRGVVPLTSASLGPSFSAAPALL